ncbi:zinc finger, C3HC4 type (RING finger) protein (macronuclear) [Tetrahymena thermophila SB210]|uniref:Zinc finger, C3HC4 type (RING finger) protein n=1 Tax=Tetrahymena thermophila (strain SB210) TaxID=312017 RepID=I7MH35_TETTS|nr:zinc finger, C3HC4 type (RING finger) protein [Tetrahymena thermophila SB210]EAR86026.2 zinc finger, C3HC4 type (RING finger) protein [Tetrahymena thermophila SB210]|eukprot:XP_976621.2 zinc finger, C3HC4 type (RING finger) protein [Tetrahymena thermophila SB210]
MMRNRTIFIIFFLLLAVTFLQFFKASSSLTDSFSVYNKQIASDVPSNVKILQKINLQDDDNVQKFQFIEPLKLCIIVTQSRLLVWSIALNQLLTDFQYQIDSINARNTLDYNILIENANLLLAKKLVLIALSKQEKKVYIFQYLLEAQQYDQIKIVQFVNDTTLGQDKLSNHLQFKIEAIEDLSLVKTITHKEIKQQILVQIENYSFGNLKFDGEKISLNLINNVDLDEKDNLSNQKIESIQRFSENTYIVQKGKNYYFSSITNKLNLIDPLFIPKNSKIISIGTLSNKIYKYLIYQESDQLKLAFLKSNNGGIFQIFNYTNLSLIHSHSLQNSIYLKQNMSQLAYKIQLNCQKQICYEEKRNLINLPSNEVIYIIQEQYLNSKIYITSEQNQIIVKQFENETNSQDSLPQNKQNFLGDQIRILDTSGSEQNTTQTSDENSDSSESDALQIVQIVLGIVGAIVFLFAVVLCIRKYRQNKFKQQQLNKQQIEANKIQQPTQKTMQTQLLQIPVGLNNPDLSGQSDLRQLHSVGSGVPLQNGQNGYLSQNPALPQQITKNQIQSNPQYMQNIPSQQQLSAPPALHGVINPSMANPIIQKDIGPIAPQLIPLVPGMNMIQDQYIAEQQKQLLLKEMQLKQMELQMREQNLLQMQQQQQQIQQQPQYGDYGNQNIYLNNNIMPNQDAYNKPANDYKKLAAQIEEKQNLIDQNDTPTQNPDNFKFNQNKYDSNPPLPAPPANNDYDHNKNEQAGQFNYSIPKKGYFFGNQNVAQNENQINNGAIKNLNNTEVQKNIFEQQMLAIMASGAVPAQADKKPFIQPPMIEDGEQHPKGVIDHSAYNQYNQYNQSQSLQQQKENNKKLINTQIQKQNFEDEILRQLQGTEVFQKNKQNQNGGLQPIQEQQFPKFIHDQEEDEQNLHKFDDDQEEENLDNYNPDQKQSVEINHINKIAVMNPNLNLNNKANIYNNQKVEQSIQINQNFSQGLQKSQQNNFMEFMKDQLGESLGNNKPVPKFIQSQIEQSLGMKNDNSLNQANKDGIDINQIKLEQSADQKENIQNNQKPQRANYDQILQKVTDNGQKINGNQGEQKQSQLEDIDSKPTCRICLDNPPQVVFQCGHTMCEPCSTLVQKKSNICPHCNIPIQTIIKLFI